MQEKSANKRLVELQGLIEGMFEKYDESPEVSVLLKFEVLTPLFEQYLDERANCETFTIEDYLFISDLARSGDDQKKSDGDRKTEPEPVRASETKSSKHDEEESDEDGMALFEYEFLIATRLMEYDNVDPDEKNLKTLLKYRLMTLFQQYLDRRAKCKRTR